VLVFLVLLPLEMDLHFLVAAADVGRIRIGLEIDRAVL
jgi:hypothetical protein